MSPKRRSVVTPLTGWLVAIIAALAGLPGAAFGGEYDVYWCQTPDGGNVAANVDFSWNAAYITASSTCGASGGQVTLATGTALRPGQMAVRATVRAPGGTSLQRVTYERLATLRWGDGGDLAASPLYALWSAPFSWGGDETALEHCALFAGCSSLTGTVTAELTGASRATWEVSCGGDKAGYCASASADRAVVAIRSMHFVVNDLTVPSGEAKIGTALDTGIHRGIETATITGQDYESGVFALEATLDGRRAGVAAGAGAGCRDQTFAPGAHDFTSMQPCEMRITREVKVDTSVVSDGEHRLQLWVIDASGNQTMVRDSKITIDNVPPPVSRVAPTVAGLTYPNALRPGDNLMAAPGVWQGSGLSFAYQWQRWTDADGWTDIKDAVTPAYTVTKADIAHKLRVAVTAQNGDGSVTAFSAGSEAVQSGATVQVASAGPQAGGGDGAPPQLVVDREQRTVQVRYGAKIMITGKLVDADGSPIGDADVDVFEQVSVIGAPWTKVATVRTDAQGGYSYKPLTRGSRVIRFAYAAKRDSGDYRATREVVIAVTAAMSIKATRRTIGSRGLIHLKGRVRAKPYPKAGAWVEVQVLDAGVWRTIGTRKTSKTGRWSFKHRVRSVSRVTFSFRVRLRQIPTVPAAESKSRPVKVRVR